MPYKFSGVITHNGRVIVIRKDNYTIESNTLVSGTVGPGGYFSYEIDGLEDTEKIALGRRNSDGWVQGHSVDPIYYEPPGTRLLSWGYNYYGYLGLGDTINRSSPNQVGADNDWNIVTAGTHHALGIKTTGELWAIGGFNDLGRLGLGDEINRSSPVQVGSLTDWNSITGGGLHTAAIKTDGSLWIWGTNYYGELGLGSVGVHYSSPVQVGGLSNWSQVACGVLHTLAIKTNDTLWTWGRNTWGELGKNNQTHYSSPVQVGDSWSQVSCGYYNTLAIRTDGSLWGWGENGTGELGLGHTSPNQYSSPVQVGGLTNWSQVFCGYYYTLAIKTDGTLWSWGWNSYGQLGLGDITHRSSPVQVGELLNWSEVDCGGGHTLATKTDSTFWSWGYNHKGQLGQEDTINRSSPVQVGASTNWGSIACGEHFTITVK